MGWSRLKLILAAVLIAANAMLLYELLALHRSTAYLPVESMEQVSRMLAKNGISVAESAIDTKKPELVIYEGTLGENYYTRVAENLSGSTTELFFNTPTGFVMNMENGDRFSFYDGFGILYECKDAPEHLSLDALSGEALMPLGKSEEKRLARTVTAFLSEANMSTGEPQLLPLSREILFTGEDGASGIRYCVYEQTVHDTGVVSLIAAFAVYEDRVIGVSGSWCFAQLDTSYSAQLLDQINILYSVKNRVLEERGENTNTVVGIRSLTLGYAAYFRGASDRFYLIPVWNTEMDSGKTYSINAVDGSLYTN